MGPNGAGKSTLIQIISGSLLPDSGTVERGMTISWPLAFGGAFQGSLTGRDNARLIARIYGKDVKETIGLVEDFAELGSYLDEPVRNYSSGMNSRLGFALSMAVDFDCFLVDEVISVGDHRFNRKCEEELRRRANKAMVLVSHHVDLIRNNCDRAVFLHEGRLHFFDDVESAVRAYEGL
jgi:capsular polysaccharide transport system ATP-binding protein